MRAVLFCVANAMLIPGNSYACLAQFYMNVSNVAVTYRQLLGAVLGALGRSEAHVAAMLTALECQRDLPHRPAHVVLL